MQKSGQVETIVDAPIAEVWEVVRDVERVGEWSHECVGISWLGDERPPSPALGSEVGTSRASSAGDGSARS